ncbi:MAG: hypothetical protein ACREFJ_13885 [Acetobacteraceae bacterium]
MAAIKCGGGSIDCGSAPELLKPRAVLAAVKTAPRRFAMTFGQS